MHHTLLNTAAVIAAISVAPTLYAAEEAQKSDWTATASVGLVSDYYARGVSQNWHKPAIQGSMDVAHSSGFYAGIWASNVSPQTYVDTTVEIDVYAGYNGTVASVEGLGYTIGLIGYFYPGGDWKKCPACFKANGQPVVSGGGFDTYEANVGVSYKWISAKASVTLGDWYGSGPRTGFKDDSNGSTYIELNAAYPLPWYGLTLIGHVGQLNMSTRLGPGAVGLNGETSPDYTDYKVGLSKGFSIAQSAGWNAGVYYVGASDSGYWNKMGFGGSSFNGSGESKDLVDNRWIVTLGRTF